MELQYKVNKPIETVFDYLTDMEKFVSVHPVITKMDKTGEGEYLVYETLKLGFIPFSFTYPASVNADNLSHNVFMKATVFGLNKVDMKFVLKADMGCTLISETITFKSPLPIKFLMKRVFKKQHNLLFKNMEAN